MMCGLEAEFSVAWCCDMNALIYYCFFICDYKDKSTEVSEIPEISILDRLIAWVFISTVSKT